MKKLFYILIILTLLTPIIGYAKEMEIVTLEACVDGDTARFRRENDEIIKARFLAIDTPEVKHPTKGEEPFGKTASNYTCNMLVNAKEIKIEYDDNSNEEDKYGRKLVWVFVDDILLQESLVKKGYAEVAYLYGDYKYTNILKTNEKLAKNKKIGIWSLDDKETKAVKVTNKTKKKSFIDRILDDLLATVVNFIDSILENLLKYIENMLQ